MSLTAGARLGPYEIRSAIGSGGMGEVYLARDTRLDRDVAIKVSTTEFSERFTREARSIAALNHSNVCHLYDVGPDYLVLEYVEGENLRGPMSFDAALPVVRQLIDGIEAAHEKNIVHRDLKTANIRITPDGVVKILDFGLAKLAEPEGSGAGAVNLTQSPTMITPGMTQAGMILGTAAYMSPEQAKGKAADRRSDIWSFGVVVYELLVGQTPFEGESAVEILGAVINKEPDWSRVPPRAQRLLRWCLEKDRRKRLAAIGDARMLLEESAAPPGTVITETKGRLVLWPLAATALLLVAVASGYGWWRATRPLVRPLVRLSVDLGSEAVRGSRVSAVLSPDGTRLVFTGRGGANGTRQLFTRRLDQQDATPLSGTESATLSSPFFSPDGDWIGFFGNGKISRVAVQGGTAVTIGEFPASIVGGASWGEDGNIIVGTGVGLMRMPASGGVAEPLNRTPGSKMFPQVLPGGRAVLVNVTAAAPTSYELLDIGAFMLDTGETKTLIHGGYWPRYLATSGGSGHLVYMHEGTLFGVAFDPRRLEVRGTPVPLLEDVAGDSSLSGGGGQFAFSNTGTFVYLSGRVRNDAYPIVWMDATGKTVPLFAAGSYASPRVSPDGTRLAYTATGSKGGDVWVYDLQRDTSTQLTFTGPGLRELAWALDSKHLVFGDGAALWWIRADGSGQPQRLLEKANNPRPSSFAPGGRLAFSQGGGGLPDVWTLPIDLSDPERPRPGTALPLLVEPSIAEVDPMFSPDGKFLAYASNESGAEEIFVRPFPGPGGKWKISTAGGKFPAFSRATRELFYFGGDDRVMVTSYDIQGGAFSAGKPRAWSSTQARRTGVQQNIDVSPDGKRVVIFPRPAAEPAAGNLHAIFLLNFFDEVRRRIP